MLCCLLRRKDYGRLLVAHCSTWNVPSVNHDGAPNFRRRFELPDSVKPGSWFPRHMSIQLKVMEGRLRTVDCIIEVHDARIPLTGRNPQFFSSLYAVRPHILVMNKMDLIDLKKYKEPIERFYEAQGVKKLLWTDCKKRTQSAIRLVNDALIELIRGEPRFNRSVKTEYQVMVVGIPNVGKSALINSLRGTMLDRKKATKEGARPGVTVRMQNRVRISDNPPIYILDTPGVLTPEARDIETGMKMALCDTILETSVGIDNIADYLLFYLNSHQDFEYVKLLDLPEPCDDIRRVLYLICKQFDLRKEVMLPGEGRQERWNYDLAAAKFVNLFRKHMLRDHCLDADRLLYAQNE